MEAYLLFDAYYWFAFQNNWTNLQSHQASSKENQGYLSLICIVIITNEGEHLFQTKCACVQSVFFLWKIAISVFVPRDLSAVITKLRSTPGKNIDVITQDVS